MRYLIIFLLASVFTSCKKGEDDSSDPVNTVPEAKLIFKFKFDSTQTRLNNFGSVTGVQAGHGAQSPRFNVMSAHYVELAPDSLTLLGGGDVLYRAPEVTTGGALAIDFSQAVLAPDGGIFFSIPLSQV